MAALIILLILTSCFLFFFLCFFNNNHHSDFFPVSMSLCESPTPSAELVEKYDRLKATIYAHLMRVRDQYQPTVDLVGKSEHGQTATAMVEDLQGNAEFQEAFKALT